MTVLTVTLFSIRSLGHKWSAFGTTDYDASYEERERTCLNGVNGLHKDTLRYACDFFCLHSHLKDFSPMKCILRNGDGCEPKSQLFGIY